jgi:hypothetical protein
MDLNKIIENLEMFDDNVCCCYDGCPVYRIESEACKDGEEVCLCFHEAVKILRQLR